MARTKKQARRGGSKPAPRGKRKPVRRAGKKAARTTAARRARAKKAAKKAVARKVARKAVAKPSRRAARVATRKSTRPKPSRAAKPVVASAPAKSPAARPKSQPKKASAQSRPAPSVRRAPTLDRERRTVRGDEIVPSPPSSLNLDRSASAARSGRHGYDEKLREHTSTGPALTAGDVDADWEDAESVGNEAPGGDNPTPDQDVVEEIGKALGITYEDNEELKGGDKVAERDRHRWELDPASREDEE